MTAPLPPDQAARLGLLLQVSRSLHDASILQLRRILAPLSKNLLGIQGNLRGVLAKSRELEASLSSDSQGLGQTVERFSAQSDDIRNYTRSMDGSVQRFTKANQTIQSQLASVTDVSNKISDVAERIKLLSINASIEAARAGDKGGGFKVIAQEVRRLAEDTNLYSREIDRSVGLAIQDTGTVFDQFVAEYGQQASGMHVIEETTVELEGFVRGLFQMIEGIFRDYDGFVSLLEADLAQISPTLQQNEIATQQIENTWKGLDEGTKPLLADGSVVDRSEVKKILEVFSRHLTTPTEAEVVRQFAQASGVELDSALKESGEDIVLF